MLRPSIRLMFALAATVYCVESNILALPIHESVATIAQFVHEFLIVNVCTCFVRHFNAESSFSVAAVWVALRLLGKACALYPVVALLPVITWSANDWYALSKAQVHYN